MTEHGQTKLAKSGSQWKDTNEYDHKKSADKVSNVHKEVYKLKQKYKKEVSEIREKLSLTRIRQPQPL